MTDETINEVKVSSLCILGFTESTGWSIGRSVPVSILVLDTEKKEWITTKVLIIM